MKHPLILALAAGAALLSAGAAHAGNVQWSIGINLPPVATVVSGGPGFYPAPVFEAPLRYAAPVVYRAAPVVYEAPPVIYDAPPVVYRAPRPFFRPAPVFFERGRDVRWIAPGHRDGRDSRGNERDGRDGHRRHHD